jgi:hypothetical protein
MEVRPWQDQPEAKPFPAVVNGQERELVIGNCAIALFRHRDWMNYLAVQEPGEEGAWTFCFDQHPLIYWMGGVGLTAADREDIRRADNKLGSFYSRYGWNPDIVIEDYPSPAEIDTYLEYVTRDKDEPEVLLNPPEGTGDE